MAKFISTVLSIIMLFVSVPTVVLNDAVLSAADSVAEVFAETNGVDAEEITLETSATTEVSVWDGSTSTTPTYSSSEGAYIIDSAAKLKGFSDAVSGGTTYSGYTVKLTVNVDWNGKTWPITRDKAFSGTFDGNGCYVSNWTLSTSGDYSGFLGKLTDATVKDLTLKNITVTTSNRFIGVLTGYASGTCNITNVDIQDTTFTSTYSNTSSGKYTEAAVLVAYTASSTTLNVTDCDFTNVTFSAKDSRSGIILGDGTSATYLTVKNCTFNDVTHTSTNSEPAFIAGMINGTGSTVDIDGIKITGSSSVSGTGCVGGLLGQVSGTFTIKNIDITGLSVSATASGAGAVAGLIDGTLTADNINLTSCSVTSTSTDNSVAFGYLKGSNTKDISNVTLENCSVQGSGTCAGGVIGYINASSGTTLTGITLKGTFNITNTSGDYSGDIVGQNKSGNLISLYDITTKDATITRSVSNKSSQGHYIGDSTGAVYIGTKNLEYNEAPAITLTGGYYVGGLIGGHSDSKISVTIQNTRINGNLNIRAGADSNNYDDAGGLVGICGTTIIDNVIINGSVTVQGNGYVGGLVGRAYGSSSTVDISNISLSTVSLTAAASDSKAGGLIGQAESMTSIDITDCSIDTINISATGRYVGGIIGRISASPATLTNCTVGGGTISGTYMLGGIVGEMDCSGKIEMVSNCSNAASITSVGTATSETDTNVGGIVGKINGASSVSITGCSNTGKLTTSLTTTMLRYFGGIVGYTSVKTLISESYNAGEVAGNAFNGGIIGRAANCETTIQYCYNTGYVHVNSSKYLGSSYYSAGGIVGFAGDTGSKNNASITIEYCYNRGDVKAYSTSGYYVGGIAGYIGSTSATIQYCYSTGAINSYSEDYSRGAIVGSVRGATIQYCYSNALSSDTYMYGANSLGTLTEVKYVATANLQGSNYTSNTQLGTVHFKTDSTNMNDGYPILSWMSAPFQKNSEGVWELYNLTHYTQFLNKVNSGYTFEGETVRLMDDIDLSALASTTSIGGNGGTTYVFKGTFDGNNYSFSNFTLNNGTTVNTGFFGYVNGATIKDLTLDNFSITGGNYTGGLVGKADGTNIFSNITIKNGITVSGSQYTGGLIGSSTNTATVNGFTATGTITVSGGQFTGGILGQTPANFVFTDISVGAVTITATSNYVGGLVGIADGTDDSSITTINATGTISVTVTAYSVGGLVGRADGNLTISTASGKTSTLSAITVNTTSGQKTGGLVGGHADSRGKTTVKDITTGAITVTSTGAYLGGIIGYSYYDATVSNVTTGNITINGGSGTDVGGYIGNTSAAAIVTGCTTPWVKTYGAGSTRGGAVGYAKSGVTVTSQKFTMVYIGTASTNATQYAGGIVGLNDGTSSLSSITVTGSVAIYSTGKWNGGVIGKSGSTTTLSNISLNYVNVSATGDCTGGYVGLSSGAVTCSGTNTYTGGSVSGGGYTGGLIGQASGAVAMFGTYTIGNVNVTGTGSYVGGLVGKCSSSVTAYNVTMGTRSISGTGGVGGFVGDINGAINLYGTNTATKLTITATSANSGGVAGYCEGANIYNTTLESVDLTGTDSKGGFVGRAEGSTDVTFSGSNSINEISINQSSNSYIGLFVGYTKNKLTLNGTNATVAENFTYVGTTDNSGSYIGAIAGYVGSASISGYDFGNITIGSEDYRVKSYIGGFIGYSGGTVDVSDCSAESIALYTGSDYSSGSTFSSSSSKNWVGGVIGDTGAATIKNITFNSLIIVSDGYNVGGIIGKAESTSEIANVKILGDSSYISTKMYNAGGLIGYASDTITITDCENHASIDYKESRAKNGDDLSRVGGLVGIANTGGTISNCKNYGDIEVTPDYEYTGGILGCAGNTTTITNCQNYGNISSGGQYVGGILGGYASSASATLTNCFNSGNISGKNYVAGISGRQYSSESTNKYLVNTGDVTGTGNSIGGIFGVVDGASPIEYCYNWGDIDGSTYSGGLVGNQKNNSATINLCYNVGTVTGTTLGSIVGYQGTAATISNCYYLDTSCDYSVASATDSGATAATIEQFNSGEIGWNMNTQATHTPYMQNIGTDEYPTFEGAQINKITYAGVYEGTTYCNDTVTLPMYQANTSNYNCYQFAIAGKAFTGTNITGDRNVTVTFLHSYANPVVKAPTCTDEGYTTYYCIGCGLSKEGDIVEATGHTYQDTVYEPTCTAEGYTLHKCINGDDSYTDNYTDKLDHVWAVYSKVEPTHADGGYIIYQCDNCKERYTVDLDPLSYNYEVYEVIAPTCLEGGYTVYKCSDCDVSYKSDYTSALGHNFVVQKEVEATCTEDGYKYSACSRCDADETETYPMLGHDWRLISFDGTTHTYKCSICQEQDVRVEAHIEDVDGNCLGCDEQFADGAYRAEIVIGEDENEKVVCFKYVPVGTYFDFTSFTVSVKYRDPEYRIGYKCVLTPKGDYQNAEDGDILEYTLRYDKTGNANPESGFSVTVVDNGTTTSKIYGWQDTATVKASSSDFLYWVDENGNIISTYKTYYFYVVKSTTLTAVYSGDEKSDLSDSKAFVTTNFAEKGDDGSLTFYSERCVNYKDYDLISYGILFAPKGAVDSSTLYTDFVCSSGNTDILNYQKAVADGQTASKCYGMLTAAIPASYLKSIDESSSIWYGRSYVQVLNKETGKIEYHYGDIVQVDMSNDYTENVYNRIENIQNDNLYVFVVED